MKNPLTPAGIEPATFRFVAQHLNHTATSVLSVSEDGRNYRPKHVELIEITNKLLLLHLVGCFYYCIGSSRELLKHYEMFCRFACHAATRCTVTYLCPATRAPLCIRTDGQKRNVARSNTTRAATAPAPPVGSGFRRLRHKRLLTCSLLFWQWVRGWQLLSCGYNAPTGGRSGRFAIPCRCVYERTAYWRVGVLSQRNPKLSVVGVNEIRRRNG